MIHRYRGTECEITEERLKWFHPIEKREIDCVSFNITVDDFEYAPGTFPSTEEEAIRAFHCFIDQIISNAAKESER